MIIFQHSGFALVQFFLLSIWVAWLLFDKEVKGKFLAAWTGLAVLLLAALTYTPSSLAAYLYLPFFLSPWTVGCTLLAALFLREYRRECKLVQSKQVKTAISVGALVAVAAGVLCWNVALGGLAAPLLLTSFILLGYCLQANRKA